eukprot:11820058-Heterocapsa_arctica.AAC.1
MIDNYKDKVFHNREEQENKRKNKAEQNNTHSGGNEEETQEYELTVEAHPEAQQRNLENHTDEEDQQNIPTQEYPKFQQNEE